MNGHFFNKQKYYVRILATLLPLTLFSATAFSVILWSKDSDNLKTEILTRQNNFLEHARTKVDNSIRVSFDIVNQIKMSKDFKECVQTPYRSQFDILLVTNLLRQSSDAFSHLGFVTWVFLDESAIIGTRGSMSKNSFFQHYNFDNVTIERLNSFLDNTSAPPISIKHTIKDNTQYYMDGLITIAKHEEMGDKTITFFVSFYDKYLLPKTNSGEGMFMVDGDGNLLMQNTDVDSSLYNQYLSMRKDLVYSKEGIANFEFMDKHVHVASTNAWVVAGWQYIFFTPKYVTGLSLDNILMFVLLNLLGVAAAFLWAGRVYSPIRKALNLVVRGKQSIRIVHLRNLLYGLPLSDEISDNMFNGEFSKFKNGCLLVVFEHSNYHAMFNKCTSDTLLSIREETIRLITVSLDSKYENEFFELDHKRYVAIISDAPTNDVKQILNQILDQISHMNVIMYAIVCQSQFEELFNAYCKAEKLIDHAYTLENSTVITEDEGVVNIVGDKYYYPLETERDIINYTLTCHENELSSVLDRIFNSNLLISKDKISHFVFALSATITRIIHQVGVNPEDILGKNVVAYLELRSCRNMAELKNKLHEILLLIIEHLNNLRSEKEQKLSLEMEDYVKENFRIDISLLDLSEKFNISTAYVSTIFKNATGRNFKDYINMCRVEKAKELLLDKNLKINTIATMVGCNNVNTFRRIFIKYTGILPGDYKGEE